MENLLDAVGLILLRFSENGPSAVDWREPIEDWKFNRGCRRISFDAARGLVDDLVVAKVDVEGVLNS